MANADDQTPWYATGLSFACVRCGRCCAGPEEGYVWVTPQDVAAIAEHLGIDPQQVQQTYVRRAGGRASLRERVGTHDCVFLIEPQAGDDGWDCAIYPVRPAQCRTWPFWPANLHSADTWARASQRCKGINHGPHVDFDEIQAKRDATAR
jgi:Fe-S-cluster containining protein